MPPTTRSAARPGFPLRLSVIVPVHNGSGVLLRCLDALTKSDHPNYEVIVVDDCSTDVTQQIAARYDVRCLRTPKNMGPSGARNLGAKYAGGEILVFVDADVILPREGLGIIAEDFAVYPDLAAVFGSYDDEPEWKTFVSEYKNLMHYYVHQSSSELAVTFWAGCGAIRKGAFEAVGGFDEATYTAPSIEDIALGFELTSRGYCIRFEKRLTAKHLKRWTVRSLLRADIIYRAVPWTRLILQSGRVPRVLNLSYASQFSSALVGLLIALGVLLFFALIAGWRQLLLPTMGTIALVCAVLLFLNWDVYQFFWRKRGLWFTMRSVVAHWAYYLYSGVTFLAVAAAHFLGSTVSSIRNADTPHK